MKDILVVIKDTPLSTFLVVSGVIFIALAIIGEIQGKIKVPAGRQKIAGGVGGGLLLIGLLLYLIPTPRPDSEPSTTSSPSAVAGAATAQRSSALTAPAATPTSAPSPMAAATGAPTPPSAPTTQPTTASAMPTVTSAPAKPTPTVLAAGKPAVVVLAPPTPTAAAGGGPSVIVPGGPAVPVSITVPGQTVRLAFEGRAQQRVSLKVEDNTITDNYVYLLNPDGKTMARIRLQIETFMNPETLPVAGTYTVLIDPDGSGIGKLKLTLYEVP